MTPECFYLCFSHSGPPAHLSLSPRTFFHLCLHAIVSLPQEIYAAFPPSLSLDISLQLIFQVPLSSLTIQ